MFIENSRDLVDVLMINQEMPCFVLFSSDVGDVPRLACAS